MNITTWLSLLIIFLVLLLIILAVVATKDIARGFILISKQIRESVQTKFIDISPSTKSLVEVAVEVWRLEKRTSKVERKLSEDQNKAFENSVNKLKRYLDKNDLTYADYTDQKYNEGLNLEVLNIEKDDSISESIIKETHEPAVFHKGQLIKKAKVVILEK